MSDIFAYWLTILRLILFVFVVFVFLVNLRFFKKTFPGERYRGKVLYKYIFNRGNWGFGCVKYLAILNALFFLYFFFYLLIFFIGAFNAV